MTRARLERELMEALAMPGVQNALTMPIKARVDMLTTGIRTPVGVKVFGDDLAEIERIGREIEHRLRDVTGTRSVYAERETLGTYARAASGSRSTCGTRASCAPTSPPSSRAWPQRRASPRSRSPSSFALLSERDRR